MMLMMMMMTAEDLLNGWASWHSRAPKRNGTLERREPDLNDGQKGVREGKKRRYRDEKKSNDDQPVPVKEEGEQYGLGMEWVVPYLPMATDLTCTR